MWSVSIGGAIGSFLFCSELFENSFGYGTLSRCFEAVEDDISTRCSSCLASYPVSLALQMAKVQGVFTESNVAKDRICCSLQGNREHKEDILSSFGREKREAIAILKLEAAAVVELVKSRRILGRRDLHPRLTPRRGWRGSATVDALLLAECTQSTWVRGLHDFLLC